MRDIKYKKEFLKRFVKLSPNIRWECCRLEALLRENPFHPSLHTKGLHGKLRDFYSFRITRNYRVIFEIVSNDEVGFITVEHRKDVYR